MELLQLPLNERQKSCRLAELLYVFVVIFASSSPAFTNLASNNGVQAAEKVTNFGKNSLSHESKRFSGRNLNKIIYSTAGELSKLRNIRTIINQTSESVSSLDIKRHRHNIRLLHIREPKLNTPYC